MADLEGMDPHLQTGLYGKKELNPDEQHHFLGTFRERVYMAQRVKTFGEEQYLAIWETVLLDHSDGILLINGNLDITVVNKYIQLATKYQVSFTLVTDALYHTNPEDMAVVLAAHTAVNVDRINIEDFVAEQSAQSVEPVKHHWYDKLLGH